MVVRKRPTRAKRERLEARVSQEQKDLLVRAATLAGCSLTEFMVRTLQEAAERVIQDHQTITLTPRDSAAFVDALLNPPAPNDALRSAAERYHALVRAS